MSVSCECCVLPVRSKSLRRVNHPSGGDLPSVVCLSVFRNPRQRGSLGPLGLLRHGKKKAMMSVFRTV